MWTLILPPLIRFLIGAALKNVPMDNLKAKAKDWVYKTVPGSQYDAAAWSIIEAAWDIILSQVQHKVSKGLKLSSLTPEQKDDVVWKSVSELTSSLTPHLQIVASHHTFDDGSRVV
jgi:hypothetical protein